MKNDENDKKYDLEERTARYGEAIIRLCKILPENQVTRPLLAQIIRSGTSIGANYCEANGASSKKDFKNKIHICQKESKETKHWLRMLSVAVPEQQVELQQLWKEGGELTLIFGKIISTLRNS